jgi:cation diffusion facilitator CzcD-associated flavoprotein CzcO
MEAYVLLSISYVATNATVSLLLKRVAELGTWCDNIYPGCCCDVWSHLYGFLLEQNSGWTWEYPKQEEILEYLIGVAQKYGPYRYIRFNTTVE